MKSLKKIIATVISSVLLVGTLAGCGEADATDSKNIIIGVCPGPYGEMVEKAITPYLEEKGYKVEVVNFTDYVQPDQALASGEIDANLMQHTVYLEKFAADNNLKISSVIEVPTAGAGVFSNSIKSFDELKSGDKVAIPTDAVNLARSLRLIRDLGVIKIKDNIDETKATTADISENKNSLEFVTIEAAQISRSLDSVAIGVIPGNYAIAANLKFEDALGVEKLAKGFKNVVAVKTEDLDSDLGKDLKAAVESEKFYDAITAEGSTFKAFDRPDWWIEKYGKDK
ncbi:MAG: metal ABC transporter substrate-binding protein [Clostridiales bacterium]|nr:metal ABC transporter substrate-binding protein [Clostridiales bacterium]